MSSPQVWIVLAGFAPLGLDQMASAFGVSRRGTYAIGDALTAAGADRIFIDQASGTATARPQLDLMLEIARAGDTIMVWRLDRLGRTMKHLIDLVGQLGERDIGLRSLNEQIDTTTANGRFVFTLMAALAAFERELLVERTTAGLQAAKAQGRVGADIVGPRRTTRWWFEPGRLGATVEVLEDGVLRTHRLSD